MLPYETGLFRLSVNVLFPPIADIGRFSHDWPMTRSRLAPTTMATAAFLAATILPVAGRLNAAPVRTSIAACAAAKAQVSAARRIPPSRIASCDTLRRIDSPRGFYVLALHGWCREDICGSTNMGWFAVQKTSGRVFEYDMGRLKVGTQLTLSR